MNLDELLIKESTPELLEEEYYLYKKLKTDELTRPPKVNIQVGVDGINWKNFEMSIKLESLHISKRLRNGTYFFQPFREIPIVKEPNSKNSRSNKLGGVRIISISSIRDVLVQRIIYNTIYNQVESEFQSLKNVSFAYRKGKSAPDAAKMIYNHILDGYTAVLDADIEGFFDNISHEIALEKIKGIISAKENPLIFSYMNRFISVDRVNWEDYKGDYRRFYNEKPIRTQRIKGIPQGGVLSGLIANIFMHDFDKWVINDLGGIFELKYIRYADDFVVLMKNYEEIGNVKRLIKEKLNDIKLKLHPKAEKTKEVNLEVKGSFINFVGFSISPTGIRIKNSNIIRFKQNLMKIIEETILFEHREELNPVISKFTYKLLGNETLGLRKCLNCNLYEKRRSWFNFFSIITDIQQLKGIDSWIRKQLYAKFYRDTGKRLRAKELSRYELPRLEQLYYNSKKAKHQQSCRCGVGTAEYQRESVFELLFNQY